MFFWILLLKLICLGTGISALFLLWLLLSGWRRRKALADKNKKLKREREKSQEFIYFAGRKQKRVSQIKHDLNNNLQVIYTLLDHGENQKAIRFLEEMKRNLQDKV